MLSEEERRGVFRWHIGLRADGPLLYEDPYDLSLISKGTAPATGCWCFNADTGRNEIRINEAVDEVADHSRYAGSFAIQVYCHEAAHSRWTERDLEKIKAMLAKPEPIPFPIANLFEDARIEQKWRDSGCKPFQWTRWFDLPWKERELSSLQPEELFWGFIVAEGDHGQMKQLFACAKSAPPDVRHRIARVLRYYRLATASWSPWSQDTLALIPLIRRWIREFPPSRRESGGARRWRPARGHFHGDDWRTAVEEESRARAKRATSPEEQLKSQGMAAQIRDVPGGIGTPSSLRMLARRHNPIYQEDANRKSFDPERGRRLIPLLAQVWQGSTASAKSVRPGKRFLTRDYVRGSQKIYRARSHVDRARHRLVLILDCSGSMDGVPARNGLTLLQVVNELHRRRKIEARVFLSFGAHVELPLPFSESLLYSLVSHGRREGIEATMRENESVLRWADTVAVFTDGNLTDRPIDHQSWRRRGIETFGLYVGDPERSVKLKKWFDFAVSRRTIEDLAQALVTLMRRTELTG